jgi:hypothetical protein
MRLEDYAARMEQIIKGADAELRQGLNRITDRHLERYQQNIPVGLSPSSPEAREQAARSPVVKEGDDFVSEVYNTAMHAGWLEEGHRQGAVGKLIFIELRAGIVTAYGQEAKMHKNGKYGIFLRLKSPRVKGNWALRDSEIKAQRELDRFAAQYMNKLGAKL